MPAATNTDVMEGKFKSGDAAMVIDGPWAVQGFRTAGVNFGVAVLPKLPNGKPSAPFVGVQGLFVNKFSKNAKGVVGSDPLPEHAPADAAVPGVAARTGPEVHGEDPDRRQNPVVTDGHRVVEQRAADAEHPGHGRGLGADGRPAGAARPG